MTSENKFKDMVDEAFDITEETENSSSDSEDSNPYKLTKELLENGWDFDSTGVYIPYNHESRPIYLKLERNPNKKSEMIYSWVILQGESYKTMKSFRRDKILTNEDVKYNEKKKEMTANINRTISSNAILIGLERTDNSFRDLFFGLYKKIIESDCLDVFKELDFEFPIIADDEDLDDGAFEDLNIIEFFKEYDEQIQFEAMEISKTEGRLFEELQNSISLTHQGHSTSRNALILQEASVFVGDSVHGLLDGETGQGKSDLAFAVGENFPKKYVKILRNISPKNIYYDCESYNEDYNILIFDDLPLNDDMIDILKELSDNTKKVKELRTVINGKSKIFRLKGKFIIILTYAKKIEDEELANRLFNMNVIVDDDSEKSLVKNKIRDNNVIGGNQNPIIERKRLILQASIHDLIEKDIQVYNPFISIFNPINYNNRDVNHFINMTKTKTFFDYYNRGQLKIDEDLEITIGSFEDFQFVNEIWAKDEEGQKYKLSNKQKQILDYLPYLTSDEAFDKVDDLSDEFNEIESKKARNKLLDDVPTKKTISKALKINQNTLTNLLDKSHENSTSKSLIELGLADKIQMEEISHSPNFYYRVKNEGAVLDGSENTIETIEKLFQETFHSPFIKLKIIINLLYYCKIVLNERGYVFMKKYCEDYDDKIDIKDYDSYFRFLEGFFDKFDYDEYSIPLNIASNDDLNRMDDFKTEINEGISSKKEGSNAPSDEDIFQEISEKKEIAPNPNPNEKKLLKSEFNSNNKYISENGDVFAEIGVDISIAKAIWKILSESPSTFSEIRNYICEGMNPYDENDSHLPLKVEMEFNRLKEHDFLDVVAYTNKAEHYAPSEKLTEALGYNQIEGDDEG